jgi:hypothetical protein
MFDAIAIVAKKDPESLSTEYRAKYKVLPDTLMIYEIVRLMTDDEEERDLLIDMIRKAALSGELHAENSYLVDRCKHSGFDKSINLIDMAEIHKNSFKKYIDANDFSLSGCLLNNWFHELDNKTDIKQSSTGIIHNDIKTSKYKIRDDGFKVWISEKKPNLETMTKVDIQNELIKINPQLWTSGFSHWWKQQNIHKGKSGRKKIN